MSLVADYNSSEESSSENESESKSTKKLPLPSLTSVSKTAGKSSLFIQDRKLSSNSVYSNPYLQSEERKMSILTKHGPLVNTKEESEQEKRFNKRQEKKKEKEPKKICLHFFKKGTCKYGDACKFLHSIAKTGTSHTDDTTNCRVEKNSCYSQNIENSSVTKQPSVTNTLKKKSERVCNVAYIQNECTSAAGDTVDDTDDALWEGIENNKRKRRVGLSDTVVPSKRAINVYERYSKHS